jgi:hypothetical protein
VVGCTVDPSETPEISVIPGRSDPFKSTTSHIDIDYEQLPGFQHVYSVIHYRVSTSTYSNDGDVQVRTYIRREVAGGEQVSECRAVTAREQRIWIPIRQAQAHGPVGPSGASHQRTLAILCLSSC